MSLTEQVLQEVLPPAGFNFYAGLNGSYVARGGPHDRSVFSIRLDGPANIEVVRQGTGEAYGHVDVGLVPKRHKRGHFVGQVFRFRSRSVLQQEIRGVIEKLEATAEPDGVVRQLRRPPKAVVVVVE